MVQETKHCNKCGKTKSISGFCKNKYSKDGYNSMCKQCRKEYYISNKKEIKEKSKQYYKFNRKAKIQKSKEYRELKKINEPNWRKIQEMAYIIKKPFEYVQSWFNKQWMKQQAQCAICGKVFSDDDCIDHDHKTLELRGLLCNSCNPALGGFGDNTVILQKAINYLISQHPSS